MEIIIGLLMFIADSGLIILDGVLRLVIWFWNRNQQD
jgi:hypothetical protein